MLTKRTNILFSETDWQFLTSLASQNQTSIGHLVRRAIKFTYQGVQQDTPTLHPLDEAKSLTQKNHIKPLTALEIKEFIAYGRK